MEKTEFVSLRKELAKSQSQMAQLLGVSLKAIHSYEQGWRKIPSHAERQILFLTAMKRKPKPKKSCWTINKCPIARKKACPAWEFKVGKLCWFINGTICTGVAHKNWKEKIKICRSCKAMAEIFGS